MRYAHAVPKRKQEAIEVLNSYNQDLIQNQKWTQSGHKKIIIKNQYKLKSFIYQSFKRILDFKFFRLEINRFGWL